MKLNVQILQCRNYEIMPLWQKKKMAAGSAQRSRVGNQEWWDRELICFQFHPKFQN